MKVQLSDHFNYKRLLRFVTPAIITMVFTSLYGVVDGLCVSNFVGDAAFASVNLIIPFPMLCGSIGFMLGSGGSALVAYKLGEGDKEKAKQLFSLMVYVSLGCGILVGALGVIFIKDIVIAGLIFAFAGLGDFTTEWIKPIGTIYVNLLKFLVVPVVLFSIADGVISLKDLKRVGSVGVKTFVYYMCTTALAVVIGLVLVNLFKGSFTPLPSADLGALEYEAKEAPSVMQVIVNIFPSNLLQPMVSSDMLPVIVIAIFLGAGVLAAGEKGQKIAELINCMEEVIMKIMMMIIKFTPIGVFCLMTNVVAVNGADIIGKLALIIGVAYLGYIVHVVVVYGLSVKFLSKMSPIKFFKGMIPAMVFAFSSTSSVATLPINKECAVNLGASEEVSSFVLPLGATINMDGTAVYMAVNTIFLSCCYGMNLTVGQLVMVVVTATLASIGTAGVSGAGVVMLAMVLTSVGIPVEGILLIYGIDRLFDMGRTTINIVGDAACAVIVSRLEAKKEAKKAAMVK